MRAVVCSGYGSPDRLEIREVDQPHPAEAEVLIRVHAATVNRTDCGLLRGKPRFARLVTGLTRPRQQVMGTGFAGYTEATGADVTQTDQRFDVVFDAVGKSRFVRCRPLLKPGGAYLTTDLGPRAENLPLIVLTRWFEDHRVHLPFPTDTRAHVRLVRDLLASGHLRPVIDRTYPLDDIVGAYHYVASERKLGNVVIRV